MTNRILRHGLAVVVTLLAVASLAVAQTTSSAGDAQIISAVVTPFILGPAAATPTGYLVGFFKHAYPETSGRIVIIVAIAAGQLSSILLTMMSGGIKLSQIGISTLVMQGIGASALSAGINSTNQSGDEKRTEAKESPTDKPTPSPERNHP